MPDTTIYKAGDTVSATLTLKPGHEIPTMAWVTLDLQPEPGAAPHPPNVNLTAYLTLQSEPASSASPASATAAAEPVILTVRAVVPRHMVGGVYKLADARFFMPGSQQQVPEPDPDRAFVRHIADDPPVAFDTPVIKDLD